MFLRLEQKFAINTYCNNKCKTKSIRELEQAFGENLNLTIHGYEFDKPCEFPFRINEKLFYGCVWSKSHESIGPWCYTQVIDYQGHSHTPALDKWGICSDDCPVERCPSCETAFTYEEKKYTNCTNDGWMRDNVYHFGSSSWCYYNNAHKEWRFCSEKCEPNKSTNSQCTPDYKYRGNLMANCTLRQGYGEHQWCPILLDHNKNPERWAICSEGC